MILMINMSLLNYNITQTNADEELVYNFELICVYCILNSTLRCPVKSSLLQKNYLVISLSRRSVTETDRRAYEK